MVGGATLVVGAALYHPPPVVIEPGESFNVDDISITWVTVDRPSGPYLASVWPSSRRTCSATARSSPPAPLRFRSRPDVGGPSAGLAHALAIADMLDPADLARSRAIATTGTIDLDGQGGHGRPLRGP